MYKVVKTRVRCGQGMTDLVSCPLTFPQGFLLEDIATKAL